MSINNSIGRSLSMFKTFNNKVLVTPKSKKIKPFVALINDIDVSNEDTQIVFGRCEETVFPDDTDSLKNDLFKFMIDKIKEVNLFSLNIKE